MSKYTLGVIIILSSCLISGGGVIAQSSLPVDSATNATDPCTSCLNDCQTAYANDYDGSVQCQNSCAPQCGGDAESATPSGTVAPTGNTPNGNACFGNNSECQSGYCNMSNINYETGAGVCANNPSAAQTPAGTQPPANAQNQSSLTGNGIEIPGNTGLPDPPGGIRQILTNLLTWLLGIVGVIALIGFVISGIQYIMATGEEDRMQTAKRNMTYSILGVVVALAGYVIVQAIDFALRGMAF